MNKLTTAKHLEIVGKHLGALSVSACVDGDKEAAQAIVSIATSLCGDVRVIAQSQPNIADEIARGRTNWPLLCDIHPEIFARNIRWLKTLPIGEASRWKKTGRKSYSFRTPENASVMLALWTLKGEPTVSAIVEEAERYVMLAPSKKLTPKMVKQGRVTKPSKIPHPLRAKAQAWAIAAARRRGAVIDMLDGTIKLPPNHSVEAFEANVRTRVRELLKKAASTLLNVPPE